MLESDHISMNLKLSHPSTTAKFLRLPLVMTSLGLLLLITTLVLLLGGCTSKLILEPGISGRFIEDSSGKPLAGARVRYTQIAKETSKETITDIDGSFAFQPEFTFGYSGYPTSPVSLQVRLELLIRDKHNWSSSGYFVNNTDVDNATINVGDIQVDKVFLTP